MKIGIPQLLNEIIKMTNKITKEFLFTELSIKIATLEMKLDKVLELLNTPTEVNYEIKTPAMTAASVQEFLNSDNETFEDSYK